MRAANNNNNNNNNNDNKTRGTYEMEHGKAAQSISLTEIAATYVSISEMQQQEKQQCTRHTSSHVLERPALLSFSFLFFFLGEGGDIK